MEGDGPGAGELTVGFGGAGGEITMEGDGRGTGVEAVGFGFAGGDGLAGGVGCTVGGGGGGATVATGAVVLTAGLRWPVAT
jgi:hypothetical protein